MTDIKVALEIERPTLPNFLQLKGKKATIDIGELTEQEYANFELFFRDELKKHWEKRRLTLDTEQP